MRNPTMRKKPRSVETHNNVYAQLKNHIVPQSEKANSIVYSLLHYSYDDAYD